MGEPIHDHPKKFNTSLTDYSIRHKENTGPYAPNLEVDALIVGAGFGKSLHLPFNSICVSVSYQLVFNHA